MQEKLLSELTLLDYFAGKALQGILAAYSGPDCGLPKAAEASASAYKYATTMLQERERMMKDGKPDGKG